MEGRRELNVLRSRGRIAFVAFALIGWQARAMASEDMGIPEGLSRSEESGALPVDTVPFTQTQVPARSIPPEELNPSPPPFSGDPGVVNPNQLVPLVPSGEQGFAAPHQSVPSGGFGYAAPNQSIGGFTPPNQSMLFGGFGSSLPARSSNPNRISRIPFLQSQPPSPQNSMSFTGPVPDQLNRQGARLYLLSLINRDRQSQGLKTVTLDDVATRAGQGHTDEMCEYRYHGHWGLDGKKPDQRYTEAGGANFVMENAWFATSDNGRPKTLTLDENPIFARTQIEQIEASFMNELPPNDGHRRNILNPNHTNVGIALSKASPGQDFPTVACTEEFINHYGDYAPIPNSLSPGSSFTVSGRLYPGVLLHNVELMCEPLPEPMSVRELNKTGGYNNPTERVASYFPLSRPGPETVAVRDTGNGLEFSVEVATKSSGLYYVWIWAKQSYDQRPFIVSSRTVVVR
jgi:uncharacterized protein YkwD